MHHQFWINKKTLERKLGSKEDINIISSDAVLDTKILIFKSISRTCRDLSTVIIEYQEHLCALSQEECKLGTYLKEFGNGSKSTGRSISNCGKGVKCSGEQRMSIRVPLLRLNQEIETFRNQAVNDTLDTINTLERGRTEYRAAISWMKSSSVGLDPDSGKGLEKFRIAQSQLRNSKRVFDRISLDSVQKIDLLVAARCNLYSQTLVSYMSELFQFSKRTSKAFETVVKECSVNPQYEFCLLKDLSHNNECQKNFADIPNKNELVLFTEEYFDEENGIGEHNPTPSEILWNKSDDQLMKLNETLEYCQTKSINLPSQIDSLQCKPSKSCTSARALPEENNASFLSDTMKESKRLAHINPKKIYAFMDFFAELDPLGISKELQT